MKVVVRDGEDERTINVPTWQYDLFGKDPEDYLAPLLALLGPDAEWEVVW